jgi:phage-related minor tail protein
MVGTPRAGVPDTGEAAVALLLGAGALAWRLGARVTAPARAVGGMVGGIAGSLVRPLAAGPTAAEGQALRAQWAEMLARTAGHMAREVVAVVLPAPTSRRWS